MIKYKDNGVEWIGQIPEDWSVIRLKDKYQSIKEIVGEKANEFERLALTLQGVIKRDKYDENGLQPEKFDGYQIIRKNDFVFKMIDLQNISTSRVGLVPFDGIVSPAYLRFRPRNKQKNKFLYYYLLSLWQNEVFNSLGGDGVRSSLTAENMGILSCPFPKYETQQKIVNILDKKCAQIDELIKLQEQEIEKLKEYKQSVISEVVTKGLDKNAKMKDSGIEWIGQIPENWELKKLKYIAKSFSKGQGITKEDIVVNGDTPCVRYGDIYTKYQNIFKECVTRTNKEKLSTLVYFSYGDILFTATGELIEEIGKSVAYLGSEECLAGGDVIVMKHSQDPEFFGYALDSNYAREYKGCGKSKLKVVHSSVTDIGNMFVALPAMQEQKVISRFLNIKCLHIDALIKLKQEKILKLQDYKKSLIYEYVTGKKEIK